MQCQYVNKHTGQCQREAYPGGEYCPIHAKMHRKDPEGYSKRMYRIQDVKRRIRHAELSDNDSDSLAEELGIARMLLEEYLNALKTDVDTIASTGKIKELLLTIEKLENSNLKINQTNNNLLAKPILFKIASSIIQIIIDELSNVPNNEVIIDRISDKILELISNVKDLK